MAARRATSTGSGAVGGHTIWRSRATTVPIGYLTAGLTRARPRSGPDHGFPVGSNKTAPVRRPLRLRRLRGPCRRAAGSRCRRQGPVDGCRPPWIITGVVRNSCGGAATVAHDPLCGSYRAAPSAPNTRAIPSARRAAVPHPSGRLPVGVQLPVRGSYSSARPTKCRHGHPALRTGLVPHPHQQHVAIRQERCRRRVERLRGARRGGPSPSSRVEQLGRAPIVRDQDGSVRQKRGGLGGRGHRAGPAPGAAFRVIRFRAFCLSDRRPAVSVGTMCCCR